MQRDKTPNKATGKIDVRMRTFWPVSAAVMLLLASSNGLAAPKIEFRPGEMVVKVKKNVSGPSLHAAAVTVLQSTLGQSAVLDVKPFQTDQQMSVVRISKSTELKKAIESLQASDQFEIVEPNYIYRASNLATPNDSDFNKLWGLRNVGQTDQYGQVGVAGSDVNVLSLWNEGIVGSRNVVVAVIDTGVDYTHPDLAANVFLNAGESGAKANNGIDDDGNGFIDDDHGWNFQGKNRNAIDDHNHGTHCSGTIGGVGNNGIGVAGVNWQVSILPVKFLSAEGSGTLADAVESINYATKMHVNIMSNSWGGGGYSEAMKKSIEQARDQGILFVAAAGNDGSSNDTQASYPASYEVANVMAVAATDNQDKIASFSNYGTRTVHVAAPGVGIYSTVKGGGYDTYRGTSMACPHVAGAAALLLSTNGNFTYADLKQRLIQTSDRVPALRKKVAAAGRVNVYNAVKNIIPPSNEPDEKLWKDVPYTVESVHPYADSKEYKFDISYSGAKMIRVHFSRIEVENKYDTITLFNSKGAAFDQFTGTTQDITSEYTEGDQLSLVLKSDASMPGWGFLVDKIQVITE